MKEESLEQGNQSLQSSQIEDLDNFIKMIKSLEFFGLLIDKLKETLKNEIKKQEGSFLLMLLESLGALEYYFLLEY